MNESTTSKPLLPLQVGKTYLSREGKRVQIVKWEADNLFPYRGDNGECYFYEGRYVLNGPDDRDLVAEAPELLPTPEEFLPWHTTFVNAWDNQACELHETARAKGFYAGGVKPLEYSLNWMHAELGEVFTALQHGAPASDKIAGFSQVEEELADVVILLMDAAKAHGLRVAEAVVAKNTFNSNRPYKHGKQL